MIDKDAYRRDVRSPEQFKKDIKSGHKTEKEIIEKYASIREKEIGKRPIVVDNGCDNSGEWMPADTINTRADFLVDNKRVEVKFNNYWTRIFHFKVRQLESYVRQNSSLLYVHGLLSPNPKYVLLSTTDLLNFIINRDRVIYWEKECFEFDVSEFEWRDFK